MKQQFTHIEFENLQIDKRYLDTELERVKKICDERRKIINDYLNKNIPVDIETIISANQDVMFRLKYRD